MIVGQYHKQREDKWHRKTCCFCGGNLLYNQKRGSTTQWVMIEQDYCSRCGAKPEPFPTEGVNCAQCSYGPLIPRPGNTFYCPQCGHEGIPYGS